MPKIILNEEAQGQLSEILNQLPISHLQQAQKIMQILNANVAQEDEKPKPIGDLVAVAHQNQSQVKKSKELIKDLPFILLVIDLIWWVFSLFDIWILSNWWIGEIVSHSLVFTLFMAFYAYVHKYCIYSWIAIITLALLNFLNIIHFFVNLGYYQMYLGIILLSGILLYLIKWKSYKK